MTHFKKVFLSIFLSMILFVTTIPSLSVSAELIPFIVLSHYKAALDIGKEINLLAITSNGDHATWKSSNSRIASVNTYGIVTAKKYGSAVITAKIKNAEASCYITVNKTDVTISQTSAELERGEVQKLSATTSNGSSVIWKSSKKSIATVDEYGTVTGYKPGVTIITASADGTSSSCTLTVKSPTVKLDKTSVRIYRGQCARVSATVSSKVSPKWKSNKKSVAIVDSLGNITAIKHGNATISATVDGVVATCDLIVMQPDISLSSEELSLRKGESKALTATVSSGISPTWTSSNKTVASVDSYGKITALRKGKAYIYASEDGSKARCTINVTEQK